ncbi:MAG: hypothetical protein ABJF88_09030 [Rhodothermales bacterium]
MRRFALLLCLPLLLTACDSTTDPGPLPFTDGVFIAEQGAFGADDGGLTVYDPATDRAREAFNDRFVQSIAVHAGRLYLATLTGVDVLDAETLERVGQYDVANPRYFVFDGDRAFVTSLFDEGFSDGGVVALDLAEGTAGERVTLGGNPDGLALVGNRLYVANFDFGAGRTVTVLDADTFEEIERIDVGCDGPRFLFADAQREIVAVCTGATTFDTEGNPTGQTNGAIVVLNGANGDEVARVDFPTPVGTASVGQDADYSPEAALLVAAYAEGGLVYRFDTDRNRLEATLNMIGEGINAVAYDGINGALYVAYLHPDAPFTARGRVGVFAPDGTRTRGFGVGVVPSHIAFLRATN